MTSLSDIANPQFFSVDSRGLFVSPITGDSPQTATVLSLSALGVSAGETLFLEAVGDYDNGTGNMFSGVVGVFENGLGFLAPDGMPQGYTYGAISGEAPGNIAQDFWIPISGTTVVVPQGATALRLATPDSYVSDNSDLDLDYGIRASIFTGIVGTTGNDRLDGTAASETIEGLAGDDLIVNIGGGRDLFSGGEGSDTVSTDVTGLTPEFVLLVDMVNGIHGREGTDLGRDTIEGIEGLTVIGSWDVRAFGDEENNVFRTDLGDDTLVGGDGADRFDAGAGNDSLIGGNGRDTLLGGDGNDTLDGSQGDAGEQGPGDLLRGGLGEDVLLGHQAHFNDGRAGALVSYADVSGIGGVEITTTDGAEGRGTIVSRSGTLINSTFEFSSFFQGSADADIITGGDEWGTGFAGLGGDDTLVGGSGAFDLLQYNDDRFEPGGGGAATVNFQTGIATDGFGDTDTFSGMERVIGTEQGDTFIGSDTGERMFGEGGDDSMTGGGGSDTLEGGDGADSLEGGADNDTLRGGDGDDYLNPGSGGFDFIYSGEGDDTIDLRDAGARDYAITFYNDAGSALVADFNIASGTGTVVTDTFEDTFLGLVEAANPWGFGIAGSQNDDVFNVTQIDGGFTYIQGQGGADTYNIDVSAGGTVRIDFTFIDSGIFQGVDADLATGVIVDGGGSIDQLNLTRGAGTLQFEASRLDDTVSGSDHADSIRASDGDDEISGEDGNDTLNGGAGDDTLAGGLGDDVYIYAFEGQDVLEDSGGSADQIRLFTLNEDGERQLQDMQRVGDDLVVTGTAGNAQLTAVGAFAAASRIETVLYRAADGRWDDLPEDIFVTTLRAVGDAPIDSNSLVVGGAADETLTVGIGDFNDLFGGGGNDTLQGNSGQDWFFDGTGNDSIEGGEGDDTWTMASGEDTFDGGDGRDRVIIDLSDRDPQQFVVETNLTTGDSGAVGLPNGRDTLRNVEDYTLLGDYDVTVTGSTENNLLQTDLGEDTLAGDAGNDTLEAGGGDDTLSGGTGDDLLDGGADDDLLRGNAGEDSLYGADGNDQLRGQKNGDLLDGGDGNDNLKGGGGNDTLYGGDGRDFLNGGSRADSIDGGEGRDNLIGRSFDDTLIGGAGNDRLNAGGDNDRLEGGAGNDFLKGGAGEDVFVFDLGFDRDRLVDFDLSEDRLEISTALAAGRDADAIAALAQVDGSGYTMDFGDGDILRLVGLDSDVGLAEQIDIL